MWCVFAVLPISPVASAPGRETTIYPLWQRNPMDEKPRKRPRISPTLLLAFIMGVWFIFGTACFLINLIFPFNLGGRIAVDMVPMPFRAYDIGYGSSLSGDDVGKLFLVPAKRTCLPSTKQISLTPVGLLRYKRALI
jgi:hypothetical protein